jgi:hypothetical protein
MPLRLDLLLPRRAPPIFKALSGQGGVAVLSPRPMAQHPGVAFLLRQDDRYGFLSALPPQKADINRRDCHVRFVPTGDIDYAVNLLSADR